MRHTFFTLTALVLAMACPSAQAENQIWTAAGTSAKPFKNEAVSLTFDADLRYQPDGDLDTVELRPGVGYQLNDRFKVSGGYLWASVRQDGPDRREHRLWQQLGYDLGKTHGFEFDGRTRLEERRREGWNDTGWRVRQEFAVKRPIEGTPFDISLSTDLFFELNDTDWGQEDGFTEARSQLLLGWEMSDKVSWEFGYMNQFENEDGTGDETNHHIVISVSRDF